MDKLLSGNQWRLHKAMVIFFVGCYIVDTQRWETVFLLTIVGLLWMLNSLWQSKIISKEEMIEKLGPSTRKNP